MAISRPAIWPRDRPMVTTRSPDAKSDLIISGGFNIYPREIEEFFQEQPEIAEAAVVGVADAMRGEVPVAYLVAKRSRFDAAPIEARCREKLASFKIPREFIAVDKLPRNAMGKSPEAPAAETFALVVGRLLLNMIDYEDRHSAFPGLQLQPQLFLNCIEHGDSPIRVRCLRRTRGWRARISPTTPKASGPPPAKHAGRAETQGEIPAPVEPGAIENRTVNIATGEASQPSRELRHGHILKLIRRESAGFVFRVSVAAGAGPSKNLVRLVGSALLSFGFTATSVNADTGRSSL